MKKRHLPIALAAICVTGVLAAPPAYADGDPLPDNVEAVLCSQPQFLTLLDVLPSVAGTCAGGTGPYVSPVFEPTPCPDCTTWTWYDYDDIRVNNAYDTDPVVTPPAGTPPVVTPPTQPVDQPVGTVEGLRQPDGQHYCVFVTPEDRAPVFQCADLGPGGALVPNFGPDELVHVPSYDPPDQGPISQGPVTLVPSKHVPALGFDLLVQNHSVDARLNQILGPGLVNAWDPVDLDNANDRQWWIDNGDQTAFTMHFALRQDDALIAQVDLALPYVGQLFSAYKRTYDEAV